VPFTFPALSIYVFAIPTSRGLLVPTVMVERQPVMLHQLCEPAYTRCSLDQRLQQCVREEELCRDPSAFVQVVTALYEHGNYELLRATFDQLEQYLKPTSQERRDFFGLEVIETLQNVASWKAYGRDVFVQFLGPKAKRVWMELDAVWTASIRLDLADRPILEGEVLIWRMTRQNPSALKN
jgi:hypothetical protein